MFPIAFSVHCCFVLCSQSFRLHTSIFYASNINMLHTDTIVRAGSTSRGLNAQPYRPLLQPNWRTELPYQIRNLGSFHSNHVLARLYQIASHGNKAIDWSSITEADLKMLIPHVLLNVLMYKPSSAGHTKLGGFCCVVPRRTLHCANKAPRILQWIGISGRWSFDAASPEE